jgi:hypothetical protein
MVKKVPAERFLAGLRKVGAGALENLTTTGGQVLRLEG